MSDIQHTISYGANFVSSFSGMEARIRVLSPVNLAAPGAYVVLSQYVPKDRQQREYGIKGNDFDVLVDILLSIREHIVLFNSSDFASIASGAEPVLYSEIGSIKVRVGFKKSSFLTGAKHILHLIIDGEVIERELNDVFFNDLIKLKSSIEEAKRRVHDRIELYIKNKK